MNQAGRSNTKIIEAANLVLQWVDFVTILIDWYHLKCPHSKRITKLANCQ